jgi:hypothetical protein
MSKEICILLYLGILALIAVLTVIFVKTYSWKRKQHANSTSARYKNQKTAHKDNSSTSISASTSTSASELGKLMERMSILVVDTDRLKQIHPFLLKLVMSYTDSYPVCISPSSDNVPESLCTLCTDDLFILFESYSLFSCWIFVDVDMDLGLYNSNIIRVPCKDLCIKSLVLYDVSLYLVRALLCEESIAAHIEFLHIIECVVSYTGPVPDSDNSLNFSLSKMESLKVLEIQDVSSGMLVKIITHVWNTNTHLRILVIKTLLYGKEDTVPFVNLCVDVLNRVEKEIVLCWAFLLSIVSFVLQPIALNTPVHLNTLSLQVNKLTVDLSGSVPTLKYTPFAHIAEVLEDTLAVVFQQNVAEYVLVSNETFLRKHGLSVDKIQQIVLVAYANTKYWRKQENILVKYQDTSQQNKKTLLYTRADGWEVEMAVNPFL